jgi:putative pyruvate formate lyase activating enzyme
MVAAMKRRFRDQKRTFKEAFHDCALCPRECHTDRTRDRLGYCQTGIGFSIGAICLHKGEEPVLSGEYGICNVFFTRCNMQCVYCQNAQISRNHGSIHEEHFALDEIVHRIENLLDSGATAVGFVSPSHVIPQMQAIIAALRKRGQTPTFVMNTNAYDKVETLATLEGWIDVYLPDVKYMDEQLALSYSDAPDYPRIALAALQEMVRQKGARLRFYPDGRLRSGVIVRHLVLPGHVANSIACLEAIADAVSPGVHLSLMAQYDPTPAVDGHPQLGRALYPKEYETVAMEMERLGFTHGWLQEVDSHLSYRPDFSRPHPFV